MSHNFKHGLELALGQKKIPMRCPKYTKRQSELFSEVWKLFSQSCTDVPAPLPCCQGKPGELAKKLSSKPQKQFILSLGTSFAVNTRCSHEIALGISECSWVTVRTRWSSRLMMCSSTDCVTLSLEHKRS